jgi:hypothetical protein
MLRQVVLAGVKNPNNLKYMLSYTGSSIKKINAFYKLFLMK